MSRDRDSTSATEAIVSVTLYNGDCLDVLSGMPSKSVQLCVTSPPYYGLRDYGVDGQLGQEKTPQEYVANMLAVFTEVYRVLRDDGTLWLNLGDSYAGSGKGPSKGKQATNVGSVGDLKRQSAKSIGLKPKDLIGIPWRVAFALQEAGWYLRNDIIWHKPNPMPESIRDRCTRSHEYLFLLSKSKHYYYDSDAILEPYVSKIEPPRDKHSENYGQKVDKFSPGKRNYYSRGGKNKPDVWSIPVKPYKGAHFATFPEALVEPCVLAGSKVGSVALDPFSGAGTVGVVCKQRGRDYIGVELNPEYVELSRKRIESTVAITTRTFL